MWLVAFIIIELAIIVWTYCRVTSGVCRFSGHLVGKVVIVTGANSGIGFETAKDLAQRGARVILACRSLERGEIAKQKIVASSGNQNVNVLQLDLESFASIRNFVARIYQTEDHLDVLINNAGHMATDNILTEDKLLQGMQLNYFGPFLLTSLLLPLLKQSAPSRIINVSSIAYAFGRVDLEDLNMQRHFSRYSIYVNAKLCTMLMTIELDRRLAGTGVTANCLHPGVVRTNIIHKINDTIITAGVKMLQFLFKDSWEGAQTLIYLAVSPEVKTVSGKYFKECHIVEPISKAKNLEVARKLWNITEKIVNKIK